MTRISMIYQDEPLLVMSVFGGESMRWLDIQSEALNRTTQNYEHAIYLNNIDIGDHRNKFTVVGSSNQTVDGKTQHYHGLLKLLNYARCGDYRAWLVLDCDCFPITSNWESILNGKNSSIVRVENLDTFYHPSAVYCVDKNLNFTIDLQKNLKGEEFDELRAVGSFFPLLRTNRLNFHPLKYGIYYNIFYHHCAGSRLFETRSDNYYKTNTDNMGKVDEEFFEDVWSFIRKISYAEKP